MPRTPEVLVWNQPMLMKKAGGFTRVFLEAVHMIMDELQLTIQPSWFHVTKEYPPHSKADLEALEETRVRALLVICLRPLTLFYLLAEMGTGNRRSGHDRRRRSCRRGRGRRRSRRD